MASDERKLRYWRAKGALITITKQRFQYSMLTSIFHEFVPNKVFASGVEEEGAGGILHTHLVFYCDEQFTWVKQNVLEQLKIPNCNIEMIFTYEDAIKTTAYMAKDRLPVIWARSEQIKTSVKRHIRAECIAFRQRQNSYYGVKMATEQLNRVEKAWFESPQTEAQLGQALWGTQPDSSGYSIQDSEPQSQN